MLIIIGILPISLQICYEGGEFSVIGRIFFISIYKRNKENGARFGKGAVFRVESMLSRPNGKIFLKNAYTTLKRAIPRMRMPYLKLHILVAGNDPANVALAYGAAGTVLERIQAAPLPFVGKRELHVDVDFQREQPAVTACVRVCLHLYQALWFGLDFGRRVWRDHRRLRKRSMSTHDQSATWRDDGCHHGQDPYHGRD